jgi:small subunit ribosomal protein S16
MLVIRFQRVGKKKQASFRVVLQERTWAAQGKTKELLGFYNPRTKEQKFQSERVSYWIQKGAQPSPTLHNLFVDAGILKEPKKKAWSPKRKPKVVEGAAAKETPVLNKVPEPTPEPQQKEEEPKDPKTANKTAETAEVPSEPTKEEEKPEPITEPKEPQIEEVPAHSNP